MYDFVLVFIVIMICGSVLLYWCRKPRIREWKDDKIKGIFFCHHCGKDMERLMPSGVCSMECFEARFGMAK